MTITTGVNKTDKKAVKRAIANIITPTNQRIKFVLNDSTFPNAINIPKGDN
jgi:hypothetical protein